MRRSRPLHDDIDEVQASVTNGFNTNRKKAFTVSKIFNVFGPAYVEKFALDWLKILREKNMLIVQVHNFIHDRVYCSILNNRRSGK